MSEAWTDLIWEHDAWMASRQLMHDTRTGRRYLLMDLAEYLSHKPIRTVERRDIDRFLGRDNVGAKRTYNRYLSDMKQFFKWLLREGIIREDPTALIDRLPMKQNKASTRAVRNLKGDLLLAAAYEYGGLRWKLIVSLWLGMGLRRFEVGKMRWPDLDLDKGEMFLVRKRGKEATLPIPPWIIPMFAELKMASTDRMGWVFPGRGKLSHSGHIGNSTMSEGLARILDRAGMARFTPHQLRHTFATDAKQRAKETGAFDLQDIQQFLGHDSLATTEAYLGVDAEDLRPVANYVPDYSRSTPHRKAAQA